MTAYYIATLCMPLFFPLFCSCYSNYSSFYVTSCVATILHHTLLLVVRDHRYFPLNSSCTICTDSLSPSVWSNWYHTIIPLCTTTECILHVSLQTFAREKEASRIQIYTWAREASLLHLFSFHAHCECADIKAMAVLCTGCTHEGTYQCCVHYAYSCSHTTDVLVFLPWLDVYDTNGPTNAVYMHYVCIHLFIRVHTQQSVIFILC